MGEERQSRRNVGRRQQRAQEILDAAERLVLRWGFDKTTIEDVAKESGVSKGTVYQRWSNREALLVALLRRDRMAMLEDLRSLPEARTPQAVFESFARALLDRPLLKAVLLRDLDVLGKLARRRPTGDAEGEVRHDFVAYLQDLRSENLIRTDHSVAEQVNVVSAVFLGFFVTTPLMPDEFALSERQMGELLGEAVQRTLDRGTPFAPDEIRTFQQITADHLRRMAENNHAKYVSAMGFDPEEYAE